MAKRAFTMFVMGNLVTPSSRHTCGGGFVLLAWVEVCALLSTLSSYAYYGIGCLNPTSKWSQYRNWLREVTSDLWIWFSWVFLLCLSPRRLSRVPCWTTTRRGGQRAASGLSTPSAGGTCRLITSWRRWVPSVEPPERYDHIWTLTLDLLTWTLASNQVETRKKRR